MSESSFKSAELKPEWGHRIHDGQTHYSHMVPEKTAVCHNYTLDNRCFE